MRKKIVILLIAMLCSVAMMAQNSSFRSTSAYVNNYQSPAANHQSPKATGSFSSISAANYASLNSEGGACYRASSGPRKGRPSDPAIGEGDFRSPVGELPIALMALLALLYAGIKYKKIRVYLRNSKKSSNFVADFEK